MQALRRSRLGGLEGRHQEPVEIHNLQYTQWKNGDIIIEKGVYGENGHAYQYTILTGGQGEMCSELYQIDEHGEEALVERLLFTRKNNKIFLNGEKIADDLGINQESAASGDGYEEYYTNFCAGWHWTSSTSFQVANILAASSLIPPNVAIPVGMVLPIGSQVLQENLDQVSYEQFVFTETFPENRQGSSVYIKNSVRFHRWSDESDYTAIGEWVVKEGEGKWHDDEQLNNDRHYWVLSLVGGGMAFCWGMYIWRKSR